MWLSSTAQQALHAVLCIAGSGEDGPVRVDEIAAVIGCPRNYLSKTLHLLTRAGVLTSERGPRGGFRLATASERLTLARVVAPFEPVGERRCLVGRATCGDKNPCAAHHRWKKVAGAVDEFFTKTTIASLLTGNPRATAEARALIQSLRRSNQRLPHGSVA
jgi:Rrf2 family protein